jgi:hypothetical protein
MFIGLGLGLRNIGNSSNGAARLLGNEAQGMAIDFRDMSMVIRDTGTPANNFSGDPNTKLTYASPSNKNILLGTGIYGGGTTLRTEYNSSLTALGIRVEPAATNLCLWSNDLTNAAWTKSNLTTAKTATGPDGVANSATTCTATAGNATALQAITSGSSARITGVALKRVTGSGNIDVTQDNGSTWTTVAVTSSWAIYPIASVTSTNPTVGIRVVTSGDAVDVAYFKHETGAVLTSPIETFGSTVTRAIDNISLSGGFPTNASAQTLIATMTFPTGTNVNAGLGLFGTSLSDQITVRATYPYVTSSAGGPDAFPTPAGWAISSTVSKRGITYDATSATACINGGTVATDSTLTLPVDLTRLVIPISGAALYSHITSILAIPRRMTNAELQAATTL